MNIEKEYLGWWKIYIKLGIGLTLSYSILIAIAALSYE